MYEISTYFVLLFIAHHIYLYRNNTKDADMEYGNLMVMIVCISLGLYAGYQWYQYTHEK